MNDLVYHDVTAEEDEMMEIGIVDDDLAIIGDELRQDAHVVAEMEKDDQEKGEGAEQVDFVDALFLSSRRFRKEHVLVPGWRVCHGVDYSTRGGNSGCREKEKRRGSSLFDGSISYIGLEKSSKRRLAFKDGIVDTNRKRDVTTYHIADDRNKLFLKKGQGGPKKTKASELRFYVVLPHIRKYNSSKNICERR